MDDLCIAIPRAITKKIVQSDILYNIINKNGTLKDGWFQGKARKDKHRKILKTKLK